MADAGNKDAALQLRVLGVAALKTGDLETAIRRLEKSRRLYPSVETEAWLARAKDLAAAKGQGGSGGSGAASADQARDGSKSFAREPSEPVTNGESSAHPSSPGMRHRPSSGASSSSAGLDPSVTQEQIQLVRRVLRCQGNFYEVLELSKTCTDDDVKKAYRKLSLKVHPDKNKAPGAEEAFKIVSRAFKCLSDSNLRHNFDTYGHEDPNQSRLQRQRERAQYAGGHPFGGSPFFQEDFDADDVFRAFFNAYGMDGRVYVNRFGSQRRAQQRRGGGGGEEGGTVPLFAILQLLPFFLFLFFFLAPAAEPLYKSFSTPPYTVELRTSRWSIPFYVKSREDFSKSYPMGSASRWRVEQSIESDHREKLESYCYQEKIQRAQVYRWGSADQAKAMNMPNCEELRRLLAVR